MKIRDLTDFKQKAIQWAAAFDVYCCLDSNGYDDPYGQFDFVLAAGVKTCIMPDDGHCFTALKNFYEIHKTWMFGLFSYDLKNETEHLSSGHADHLSFPQLFFFVPLHLIAVRNGEAEVLTDDTCVLLQIDDVKLSEVRTADIEVKSRISKSQYLETVRLLQEHIARGDIYEVNFCQEFFAEHALIDPLALFNRLNQVSPTPFSGFFRIEDKYILSASPERFLCKRGRRLLSQPIKGTAKRGSGREEDEAIKKGLREDLKEQTENVMIVDLVRNDLTRSAVKGSVRVDELFGIYPFPQVYQMISTVSCELMEDIHLVEAISNAFPMGSMTGAPKVRAMQLIEQYEASRRGAYSGAFGYISPDGDFDFNVIIRSILYAADRQYLSFQVGGAITHASDAEAEYEECLLKASAMIRAIKADHS
ncbi:anthranilate synthase component I family protein [Pedobacter sp. JY14-1]|uniref:anthranilate synthase component I family protein n=1 Tax=Pedobacter sp. JY14-1 TaxID=3034151 RepID=UPI0023E212F4|nr:anthranilate synthase component I family protein [Pedobacter sp. JY14-1]